MNLREIIMDAIKYPISDTRKFLIFCALIIHRCNYSFRILS